MQETIVRVQDLSHKYTTTWAIRDINFEITRTGILGLLGSNGAGKSTTMNIMCGVLNPTEGRVWIDEIDLRKYPEEAKKLIGFLPQNPPLNLDLTVDEFLTHCAHLRRMGAKNIPAALDEAKVRCGIAHVSGRLIRNLSGGYRQRVGIAQAIIHKPRLVVLDEPTNGLDPNQITEVRGLIREIGEDRSVIFSTHILSEVQAICKEVMMVEEGQVVFSDTMDAFNNYIEPDSVLVVMEAPPTVQELEAIPGVVTASFLNKKRVRLRFEHSQDITERIIELGVARGWRLREITIEGASLDAVFAQLSVNLSKQPKERLSA